jgi:CheY-like chemotaxis protein
MRVVVPFVFPLYNSASPSLYHFNDLKYRVTEYSLAGLECDLILKWEVILFPSIFKDFETMTTSRTPTHIFVVENDKMYVGMLDYIFSKDFSYRFVNFKSGEECLENMHLNPDLMLLDCSLPGINGYETLIEIRKNHPHVYIIMLLGDGDEKLPSDLFEAGADDYIMKENMKGDEITEKIETFLTRESLSKKIYGGSQSSMAQVYFFLLALLAVGAGVFYYQ